MSTAAALLSLLPVPSPGTEGPAAPAEGEGAGALFGDVLAGMMAPVEAPGMPTAEGDVSPEMPGSGDMLPVTAVQLPYAQAAPAVAAPKTGSESGAGAPLSEHGSPAAVFPAEAVAEGAPAQTPEPTAAKLVTASQAAEPELPVLRELAEAARPVVPPAETPRPAFSLQQVAETTATPYAPPPSLAAQASALSHTAVEQLTQLSVAIQKKLSEGTTKFQLELKPADLGRVDVALTITGDGKVSAHLQFDAPITAATFAARESELRQQLTAAGLKLDGEALTFTSRPSDNPPQQPPAANQNTTLTAFADQQNQQQARHNPRQAAKALKQAQAAAAEADLDAALHNLRNRPAASRLALDLTV